MPLDIAGFRLSSPRIHMDKKTTEMLLNQPTIASVMRNAGSESVSEMAINQFPIEGSNALIWMDIGIACRYHQPRLFMRHVDKGFQPGVFVRSQPGFS